MKRLDFAMEMISIYGKPWLLSGSFILLASVLAMLFLDIRWGILFLMLIFIVAPAVFAFLYFFYGLQPLCVVNVIEHRITFNDNDIVITLFPDSIEDDEDKENIRTTSVRIAYNSLSRYNTGIQSVTFPISDGKKGFLWIPLNAFQDQETFKRSFEKIITCIRESSPKNR